MHDMRTNVWRKNWADSFFTLDRSMPCQWKRQKFEDTCRKCNSRRRVNQSQPSIIKVLAECGWPIDWYVHWPSVDILANMLTNMSSDILTVSQLSVGRHVDRPSISTDSVDRYLAKGCSNFTRAASFTKLSSLSFREFGCFGPNCPFNRY